MRAQASLTSHDLQTPGEPVALSVSAAIQLLNDQLFRIAGPNLMVEGEVAEWRISQGKWVRFVLKDTNDGAILNCFLTVFQLNVDVKNGDRIAVHATPSVYPKYGQLTLNVNRIEPLGEGALRAASLRLRAQLASEGLFDVSRKRALPDFPAKIGLITSREAAACSDFVKMVRGRWGGVEIELAHVAVQGERAVAEICKAIELFCARKQEARPDVLVLTRGGGSAEELMAFNAEAVVRAVFGSNIPTCVAVGHERDESLAEFAADVRASTPTHAAECVVPDKRAVHMHIEMLKERMIGRINESLMVRRHNIESTAKHLTHIVLHWHTVVTQTVARATRFGFALERRIQERRDRLASLTRLIDELSPARVLRRGYALVRKGASVIKDAGALDKDDTVSVQFAHGSRNASIL